MLQTVTSICLFQYVLMKTQLQSRAAICQAAVRQLLAIRAV